MTIWNVNVWVTTCARQTNKWGFFFFKEIYLPKLQQDNQRDVEFKINFIKFHRFHYSMCTACDLTKQVSCPADSFVLLRQPSSFMFLCHVQICFPVGAFFIESPQKYTLHTPVWLCLIIFLLTKCLFSPREWQSSL